MFSHLVTSVGQKKNSESPWGIEPQTFGFALWCSVTEHRDSMVSEVYYEVQMTHVLHTARISNVDSGMFFKIEIVEMVSFELGKELRKMFFHLVTRVEPRKNSESPWGEGFYF